MGDLWAAVTAGDFLPHGYCLSWKPWLIWLHAISDSLIVLAYFSIPLQLLRIIRKRTDFPFNGMVALFGLFIFSCGATHLMGIWTLWFPHYGVEGIIKAVTAVASIGTAVALVGLSPKILALPSPSQLEQANRQLMREIKDRERFEKALRERERQLQLMVETVEGYAILSLDNEGRVTTWNHGAERIKGYSTEEISGKHFSAFYTPEDIQAGKPELALKAARDSGSYAEESWRLRKDGTRFLADVLITAVHDTAGELQGYIKITRDVTERRKEQAHFQALLEAAPDPIVVADQKGQIVLVNSQAEKQFGYQRDELLNQEVEKLIPQRFHAAHKQDRSRYAGQPHTRPMGGNQELSALRKDGTEFPVEIALSPLRTDDGLLITTIIRDVTERREAEHKLAERAEELARSNAELERFVYVSSHDLREPIRKILVFGGRLRNESQADISDRGLHYLERMLSSATRMESLISDLLAYSRTQQSVPHRIEPVDLNKVATEAVDDLAALVEEVGARVEVGDMPTLEADPTQIRQLIQNLLGNALKFHRDEGQHVVKISGLTNATHCRFFVKDNGIGFDPDTAAQMFDVFKRLHSSVQYEGNGIGLSICRRIVERHGGKISARGKVGSGAVFEVELPLTQDRSPQPDEFRP